MDAVVDESLLVDQHPSETLHNARAKILRHGLVVSAFSSLEDYMRTRLDSLCQYISHLGLQFSGFDAVLQNFLLVDSILGLANQIQFKAKADRLSFADAKIRELAAFSSQHPTYTSLGFSPKGSNVGEADVYACLKSFSIVDPWGTLSSYASQVGVTSLDLKNDFITMSKARNSSAHSPSGSIASNDLRSHIQKSILIAVTFDMVMAMIAKCLRVNQTYTAYKSNVAASRVVFRFIDNRLDGKWDERKAIGGRVIRTYDTEDLAFSTARTRQGNDLVIVRNAQGKPVAVRS